MDFTYMITTVQRGVRIIEIVTQYMINHHDGLQQIFIYWLKKVCSIHSSKKITLLSANMGTSQQHEHILGRVSNSNLHAYISNWSSNFIIVLVSLSKESLHIYKFYIFTIWHGQLQLQVSLSFWMNILPWTQFSNNYELEHIYIKAYHFCIENDFSLMACQTV